MYSAANVVRSHAMVLPSYSAESTWDSSENAELSLPTNQRSIKKQPGTVLMRHRSHQHRYAIECVTGKPQVTIELDIRLCAKAN